MGGKKSFDKSKIEEALKKNTEEIGKAQKTCAKSIKIKVLKNRNGQNNGIFELAGHLDRYFIGDTFETKKTYKQTNIGG